jgi:RND family efflux transporter MFP subunit
MRFDTTGRLSNAVVTLGALVAAGLVAAGPAPAQSLPFQTGTAEYRTLADERRFDGRVEAVYRSTISAQTGGEIIELPFDVNDYVPKGAVVVRFDDGTQRAALDKAVASEMEAESRLTEAQSAHQRNLRLIKENAVSKSQLEKSEADLKTAQARLKSSRAARDEAQEQLDYTVVKAPYSGVLVERFVEIGEQVQVGQKLGTGLSLEKLRVEVEVPAQYIAPIRDGSAARVRLPGAQENWLEAGERVVFPYADPKSHSFTVRVALPEGQHGLYPGMLVKVSFAVGEEKSVVVPSQAIVHRSEVTGVYVVDAAQQVQFRQIREGREVPGGLTMVLAGLEAGERVALDPVAAVIYLKREPTGQDHE